MLTSYVVGAVFRVLDEATPGLKKILESVRELNKAITLTRDNLKGLGAAPGLGAAIAETDSLAAAWRKKRKSVARLALNERTPLALWRSLLLFLLFPLLPLHLVQLRLYRLELPLQGVNLRLQIAGHVGAGRSRHCQCDATGNCEEFAVLHFVFSSKGGKNIRAIWRPSAMRRH